MKHGRCRALEFSSFGLAFLLERFCGVHANKKYQRADWRVRPLPAEMSHYAREVWMSSVCRPLDTGAEKRTFRNVVVLGHALSAVHLRQAQERADSTVSSAKPPTGWQYTQAPL
jgi:hypothetical protein